MQNSTNISSTFSKYCIGYYGFAFNGQEKTDEVSGVGNHLDFKYRGYDPQTGKFWSVDPLFKDYPWNSMYCFAENDVIRAKDLEGAEKYIVTGNLITIKSTYVAFTNRQNGNVPNNFDVQAEINKQYDGLNSDLKSKTYGLNFTSKDGVVKEVISGNFQYNIKFDIKCIITEDESKLPDLKRTLGNEYGGIVLFGDKATYTDESKIDKPIENSKGSAGTWQENGEDDVILFGQKTQSGIYIHEFGHDMNLTHFGSMYPGSSIDPIGNKGRHTGENGEMYNSDGLMSVPFNGIPFDSQIKNILKNLPGEIKK